LIEFHYREPEALGVDGGFKPSCAPRAMVFEPWRRASGGAVFVTIGGRLTQRRRALAEGFGYVESAGGASLEDFARWREAICALKTTGTAQWPEMS